MVFVVVVFLALYSRFKFSTIQPTHITFVWANLWQSPNLCVAMWLISGVSETPGGVFRGPSGKDFLPDKRQEQWNWLEEYPLKPLPAFLKSSVLSPPRIPTRPTLQAGYECLVKQQLEPNSWVMGPWPLGHRFIWIRFYALIKSFVLSIFIPQSAGPILLCVFSLLLNYSYFYS